MSSCWYCLSLGMLGHGCFAVGNFFPGMPECPGTQWISTFLLCPFRMTLAISLIAVASWCPGAASKCLVHLMASNQSLKITNAMTPCTWWALAPPTDFKHAILIAHSSVLNTSILPVPRLLWKTSYPSLFKHITVTLLRPIHGISPSIDGSYHPWTGQFYEYNTQKNKLPIKFAALRGLLRACNWNVCKVNLVQ